MSLVSSSLTAEFERLSESFVFDSSALGLVFELNWYCNVVTTNPDINLRSRKWLPLHPDPFFLVHPAELRSK